MELGVVSDLCDEESISKLEGRLGVKSFFKSEMCLIAGHFV